jgi:drug/metabolite transporter (DMT)-like permease
MPATRQWYGFFLSLLTAVMWGVLPVVFELLLDSLDVVTLTWIRFCFSACVVWVFLAQRNQVPSVAKLSSSVKIVLLLAILSLLGNFILYLMGLVLLDPESTQVLIQLAPFILMFGSVIFFGETFSRVQCAGAAVLILGLGLFFNDRLPALLQGTSTYTLGIVCMLAASVSWGVYGLLQKQLLASMNSIQLTLLIYAGGVVALALFISPSALLQLDAIEWAALGFCCINMVVGYGAFTEALHVWQAARVSAVIALAPIVTILSMYVAVAFWPAYFTSSELNPWSYAGAVLVVAGSMLAALGKPVRNEGQQVQGQS